MTNSAPPWDPNPRLKGALNFSFGKGHHISALSLSMVCLGVK